ncbi:MAG: Xaa-Pro peptidase family protein [Saccharofermentans sp.]|nr:Xaa-Pro peptidase family protein [Saccharofermentans sp.]
MNRIPEGSAVFVFAGKGKAMSQDTDYRFLPDRNFYYLTGLSYENGKLILIKDEKGDCREMLFALPKNDLKERWTGKRMEFSDLSSFSGICENDIYDIDEFEDKAYEIIRDYNVLFDSTSIVEESKTFAAKNDASDIGSILTHMRMVKTKEEIESIKAAARITEDALCDMKSIIRGGSTELELYTKLEYEMARRGSLIPAFETIVSIDTNTFYLHHSNPDLEAVSNDGSMIQIDVGARVNGYCADISRVYFLCKDDMAEDDKRLALHGLIKELRKAAWDFIKPGETFKTLNSHMMTIVAEFLLKHGLLEEGYTTEDIREYYWHNTSHHLGLDVHDICERDLPFEAGNCLAVEPGVYIKSWGIGFRIEDDVVVTDDGCELLSSGEDSLESCIAKV